MWHTRGGRLALGDPGKLCHPVIIPSLPVGSQPAHRGGNHHHGDRLSGMCGSCQREPSSAADGKLSDRVAFEAIADFKNKARAANFSLQLKVRFNIGEVSEFLSWLSVTSPTAEVKSFTLKPT